jgi:hypothetical protein
MVSWDVEDGSFDAVVSFYALIHLSIEDQYRLISCVARWLTLHGYFLAIVGHEAWSGTGKFFGAPMWWEQADEATYLEWMNEIGSPLNGTAISLRAVPATLSYWPAVTSQCGHHKTVRGPGSVSRTPSTSHSAVPTSTFRDRRLAGSGFV